jgi:putative ABC transport system permease protein
MKPLELGKLALKQVARNRVRSLLTAAGVAACMFLYTAVETMQHSLATVIESGAEENTLVVYRENRFCPTTSRLPEHYLPEIERINGVAEAIPIQVTVNNCGASLDVITFRGVPPEALSLYNPSLEIVAGSMQAWQDQSDAALVGEHFAQRRSLRPGDTFEAVGVRVYVAGIIRSELSQDNNVAYVHLPFLQLASRVGLGTVTQFNVRLSEGADAEAVASEIDTLFASDAAPTTTRPEKAFFAQTAQDMIEMIGFTRWIGLGAVFAVLGLVANALLIAVKGRVKESAILQTIGFSRRQVGLIMIGEGALLGLLGGAIGSLGAAAYFHMQSFTLGNEGLTLALAPSLTVTLSGLAIAVLLGLVASIWPAVLAATRPLVSSLR